MMVKALIRKFWKLLVAVLVTCAVGIAVMVGMSGGTLSLQQSTEDYLAEYHYYDASITTEVTAENVTDDLLSVKGVARVDARMVANTVMVGPNRRILSIRAATYGPDDWQRFVVWEQVPEDGRDSVMVECEFAQENGIQAGDEVRIRVDGSYRTCVVGALVSTPETLSVRALENQSPRNSDFGAVYVPIGLVAKEKNREYEDAKEEIAQRESELADGRVQLDEAYGQALEDLSGAQSELEQGMQAVREALTELASKRVDLDEKEEAVRKGLSELADKKSRLIQARDSLEGVCAKLHDELGKADEAMDALEEKRAEAVRARDSAMSTVEKLSENISLLEEAQKALSEIDAGIAEANELAETLASEQVRQLMRILREMNPDIKLSWLANGAKVLDEFRALCEECGIDLNAVTLHEMANSLVNAIGAVEADCQTLHDPSMLELARRIERGDEEARESEEGKALARTVRRYTGETLTEESLLLAAQRCQRVQDFIVENDVGAWAEHLLTFPDYTYEDVMNLFMGIDAYVEEVRSVLGDDCPEVDTVGQLLAVYDGLPAAIESVLEQLRTKRAEVVSRLADQGIDEDELPDALEQLYSAKEKAQGALAQIEAGLDAIDESLEELRAGKERLEANVHKAEDELAQVDAGLKELTDLRRQAHDALGRIERAQSKLDGLEAQAQDGLAALDGLGAQLDAKRQEARAQWLQGLVDLSDLRRELERARADAGSWEGYDAFHNQFLLWFDEGANPEQTLAAARAALAPIEVKSSFTYENSPVKTRLDDNVAPLKALSHYLPVLFFGIVLMVTFLFMSLMVRQSRVNIGILRALGKSAWQVRAPFCLVGLLISIGAIVPGFALGWAVTSYVGSYYSDFFKLPSFTCQFDGAMVAWALVLTLVVVQLATLIGTTLIASVQPSESLSRSAPASTRIPRVMRALTSRLGELSKFGILSLLRNPVRVGFSVVCIAASVAIIFAAQAFIASKNQLVHQEFDQRLAYDCQVFLSEDPDEQALGQIEGLGFVRDLQRVGFYTGTISGAGGEQDAVINALPSDTDLVGIYDAQGRRIAVPDNGIVLDDRLAKELDVGVGDTVLVQGVSLRVQALSHQDSNRVQYVSLKTMPALGASSIGCFLCRVDSADQQRLMEALSERDDYVLAVFTDVLRSSTERLHATYDMSAWILTSFAIVIGALVVFNVMQANMLERRRELCVLRTLGFSHRELSRSLLWQTVLYVAFACALGFPAGKLVALSALEVISSPDRTFAYANGPVEYAITLAIVLLYAVASHVIAMRSMRAWDINEGVKDKE